MTISIMNVPAIDERTISGRQINLDWRFISNRVRVARERKECGLKRTGCDFCYFTVRFTSA